MLNAVPVPSTPIKDPYAYLLTQPTITKLFIIENEFTIAYENNQNPPYSYPEVMKILLTNYKPGDFNQIPVITDESTLLQAFRNAHKAHDDPDASYYSCMCEECKRVNLTFTKRDLDLYGSYIPKYCPSCLQMLTRT